MNVVLLRGVLSSAPRIHALPSGDDLGRFEITTTGRSGTHSVPVVLVDPSATATGLQAGDAVVTSGVVRRRFFRAGGVTRSTTEVVAERLVPARQLRRAAGVVDRVQAVVEAFDPNEI